MLRLSFIVIQNLTYQTSAGHQVFSVLNLNLDTIKTGCIGRNGIGKSTLLKLIVNELSPTSGTIKAQDPSKVGYCPQDFTIYKNLTIAEFFGVTEKLGAPPELLLLDESTNHLDWENLKNLESILKSYKGVLIMICHDQEFLARINISRTIYASDFISNLIVL